MFCCSLRAMHAIVPTPDATTAGRARRVSLKKGGRPFALSASGRAIFSPRRCAPVVPFLPLHSPHVPWRDFCAPGRTAFGKASSALRAATGRKEDGSASYTFTVRSKPTPILSNSLHSNPNWNYDCCLNDQYRRPQHSAIRLTAIRIGAMIAALIGEKFDRETLCDPGYSSGYESDRCACVRKAI